MWFGKFWSEITFFKQCRRCISLCKKDSIYFAHGIGGANQIFFDCGFQLYKTCYLFVGLSVSLLVSLPVCCIDDYLCDMCVPSATIHMHNLFWLTIKTSILKNSLLFMKFFVRSNLSQFYQHFKSASIKDLRAQWILHAHKDQQFLIVHRSLQVPKNICFDQDVLGVETNRETWW